MLKIVQNGSPWEPISSSKYWLTFEVFFTHLSYRFTPILLITYHKPHFVNYGILIWYVSFHFPAGSDPDDQDEIVDLTGMITEEGSTKDDGILHL